MTIKEKILKAAKTKGFTVQGFCDMIGMSYGNFKGSAKKRPINSTSIENILTIMPSLNLNWLFKNQGEMFLERPDIESGDSPPLDNKSDYIQFLENKLNSQSQELKDAYKEIGRLEERLNEANKKYTGESKKSTSKEKLKQ